jgi:hypothetical protein
MKETYVYREHSIDLDLSDITGARIRWTYFIDGRYCVQGATDLSSIEAVRVDALALAHRSIDVLDSMRRGKIDVRASCAIDPGLVHAMMDRSPQRARSKAACR